MKTATRTDVHRPSAINPEEYDYVGCTYEGPSDGFDGVPSYLAQERARIRAHMARTGGGFSQHHHGGSCHICGANALYMSVFHHVASNAYIETGSDCAEKLGMGDPDAFKVLRDEIARARTAKAGKTKAQQVLADAGIEAAWEIAQSGRTNKHADRIRSIVGKLIRYGSVSEAQVSYLAKLIEWEQESVATREAREAARQAEHDAAAPVPVTDKRVRIQGEVIATREPDRYAEFPSWKILVRTDEGYKLWGNRPSGCCYLERGDRIAFDARLTASDDDPKFGFFSRPTKVVAEMANAPKEDEE